MGLEEGWDKGRSVGLALPSLAPNTCGVLLAESVPGTSWFAHNPVALHPCGCLVFISQRGSLDTVRPR